MKRIIFTILLCSFTSSAFAAQSTILEAEGEGCTSLDASRRQAQEAALKDAERNAMEMAGTHIKSESLVKDAEIQADLIKSFSHASVRLIRELSRTWKKEGEMDSCLYLRIEAEVIPDPATMKRVAAKTADDPTAPLNVKVWSGKAEYKRGEMMRIYLKGNKPFYGRIVYRDASNHLIQLLPNPHRKNHYFNGGTTYEIPSGNDRFELEVTPPFGEEQITVYASTAPAGTLELQDAGDVFVVTTPNKNVGIRTRGIAIREKDASHTASSQRQAEFAESKLAVMTGDNR